MSALSSLACRAMGRWEPNARGRLEQAAMELYGERGFDETTVAEIAARAGLTERTFFRHYADKREVLFAGALLAERLAAAVADAPESATPLDAIAAALEEVGALIEESAAANFARARQTSSPRTRSFRSANRSEARPSAANLTAALHERGTDDPAAALVAETGIAVFRVAFSRWLTDAAERGLPELIRESLSKLRALTADNRKSTTRAGLDHQPAG